MLAVRLGGGVVRCDARRGESMRRRKIDLRDKSRNSTRDLRSGTARRADSTQSVIAIVAAYGLGHAGILSLPLMVGGTVTLYEVGEGTAGLIASTQFFAQGLVATIFAFKVDKIDFRGCAILACLLILSGSLLSAFASSWELLLVSRFVAGVGEGAVLSIASAAAAQRSNPHRTFSVMTVTMLLVAVFIYSAVPALTARFGPVSVFHVLSALAVLAIPLTFMMPSGAVSPRESVSIADTAGVARIVRIRPLLILAGIGLFTISGNILWPYAERIGVSVGLSLAAIGLVFITQMAVGLFGPVLAPAFLKRWGYQLPMFVGIIVLSLGVLALALSTTSLQYYLGAVSSTVAYMFLLPFFQALTAHQDPSGRLAVGTVPAVTAGYALAPVCGGLILLSGGDYAAMGWASVAVATASLLSVASVARRADAVWPPAR